MATVEDAITKGARIITKGARKARKYAEDVTGVRQARGASNEAKNRVATAALERGGPVDVTKVLKDGGFQLQELKPTAISLRQQDFLFEHIENNFIMQARNSAVYNKDTNKDIGIPNLSAANPALLINELRSVPEAQALFRANELQLSSLVPMIRLFKLKETAGENRLIELAFDDGKYYKSNNKIISAFSNRDTRGVDVGIKEISVRLMATNPAEVKNNIECTVKLFLKNFNALTKIRTNPQGQTYSFSDLILRSTTGELDADRFRLQLLFGWQKPDTKLLSESNRFSSSLFESKQGQVDRLVRAIEGSATLLNLTIKEHTFDVGEDGTIELTIVYQSYAETILSQPGASVLLGRNDAALKEAISIRREIKQAKKKIETEILNDGERDKANDNFEDILDYVNDFISDKRAKLYRSFLTELYDTKRLFAVSVPLTYFGVVNDDGELKQLSDYDFKKWKCNIQNIEKKNAGKAAMPDSWESAKGEAAQKRKKSTIGPIGSVHQRNDPRTKKIGKAVEEAVKESSTSEDLSDALKDIKNEEMREAFEASTNEENPKKEVVFFLLGDLIKIAFNNYVVSLGKDSNFKLRPVFGPISTVGVGCGSDRLDSDGRASIVSIGDIPISLELFYEFFIEKIVKEDRIFYDFITFTNDIINFVLPNAVRMTRKGVRYQFVREVYSTSMPKGFKNTSGKLDIASIKDKNLNLNYGADNKDKVENFLLLYVINSGDNGLRANEAEDSRRGILHLKLGDNQGIVKKYSFSRNNSAYLAEARIFGSSLLGEDLSGGNLYNLAGSFFGNGFFTPGQQVYVDPRAIGIETYDQQKEGKTVRSAAKRANIGGYYVISSVEHSVGPGFFDTSIDAIWDGPPVQDKVHQTERVSSLDRKEGRIDLLSDDIQYTVDKRLAKAGLKGAVANSPLSALGATESNISGNE